MKKTLFSASVLLTSFLLTDKKKSECCGIIGIVSKKKENIAPSLSLGVELLKNRGYDSAGIVVFSQEEDKISSTMIKRAQQKGEQYNCIERLIHQVSKKIVKSHIGIGHTRWATCGEKVEKNAHPHFDNDQNIFLVHNGIIGGYPKIKTQYLEGVNFSSQTDSEVIVQLLGKFKKQGMSMIEAIKKCEQIMIKTSDEPQWGIVVMDKSEPDKIWTSTHGSPILIGFNQQQIYVASESIAFKKQVDFYFDTNSGQIWQLYPQKIPKIKQQLEQAGRLICISENDKKDILVKAPEPYKSFYSYEIRQESQIKFKPQFNRVQAVAFGPFLTFIACGSSYYAAQSSFYFFKLLNAFKKISLFDPAEMLENDIIQDETVVVISQSGETKDLINKVEKYKDINGVKTIGIINVEGSTIARKVDFPIYIKVGREVSVAATKSMLHQSLNLVQLSVQVARKKNSAPENLLKQIEDQLKSIPEKIKQTIQGVEQNCEKLAQALFKKESIYLLAQREALAIAREAALKIKQLNYIHAEALGACEMKHGPIALIDSEHPRQSVVIIFILDNETFEQVANAIDQMISRAAKVILVTNCKERIFNHYQVDDPKKADLLNKLIEDITIITVPNLKHLSHLLCLIPMQILVQKIAILKNINPDMPRNLAKTVTV